MQEDSFKGKKVIVAGGAGVIGRELIGRLEKEGAIIRCFDLLPRPVEFPAHIQYFQKDLSFLNQLEFSGFEPDIVFHLAATFELTKEDPDFWD